MCHMVAMLTGFLTKIRCYESTMFLSFLCKISYWYDEPNNI